MYSMKKRRSSIKRSASEPVAAVVGTRPDRRISFSGKMSVREFCGEEEPQTWNKSYELSDHVNASGPEASSAIAAGISRSVVIGSTEESDKLRYAADKENIHWDPMSAGAIVGKSLPSRCGRSIAAAGRIVQQIEESNADVTLVSDRIRVRHLRSQFARRSSNLSENEHPSITFSMYEHDYRVLQTNLSSYSEPTEDYLRELNFSDCVMEPRSVKKDKCETVLCNEGMVESMCGKFDMSEAVAASQTICMNERIETEDERCTNAYGLTLGAVEDMQFSPVVENGQTNEKYTQNSDTTSFAKAMEVESPVYEVSRKCLFEAETTNLVQVQITKSFNDSLKAAPLNIDETDKDCNLRTHSNMIMDISSSNGMNIAEVDEPRGLLEPEVEHLGHKVLPNLELKLVTKGEPGVKSCGEIMNGENDLRNVVSGPLAGTTKGGNIPKVVVVRKICAPITSVEKFGLKRFQFSQKKATPQCPVKEVRETTGPVVGLRNLNNISLINTGDISVASNYSSPLFPAEFVSSNKKLNFRQLNDEIERGQIQIYSPLCGKVPSARRKSVGKQLFPLPKDPDMDKHAKDGEAIKGSEENMRVSLCGNLSKHAKRALRLSEACNMSDNTSFLIKAKLGDETASRNSSSSNQRDTIHFNEDVNMTIVCDEDTLNPECIARGKPECCNEGDAESIDFLTQKLNETRAAMFGDSKKKLERGFKEETLMNGHDESMDVSPIVVRDQREQLRRLYEGTPHRSVLEFECLELEVMQEQQRYEEMETAKEERHQKSLELSLICCESEDKPSSKLRRQTIHDPIPIELDVSGLQPLENENVSNRGFVSPIISALIRKRLTSNLTPNLPIAKKRQTLVFHNCDVEESVVYIDDQIKEIKGKEAKYEATAVPEWIDNNTEPRSKEGDNRICKMNRIAVLHDSIGVERIVNNTAESSSLNANALYSLTPTKFENMREDGVDLSKSTAASHIPVRIDSTDKNKSNKCCPTPEKWDEPDTNQSLETIQILRKAMDFIQQHEKSIRPPASGNDTVDNHTLSECGKQQSAFFTFEANPITISDVSAHYLAQQNNRETNWEEGHENTTIGFLSDCEFSDIDKTRLTLVESLISETVDVDDDDEHDKALGEWECDEVSVGNCLQKAVENKRNASLCRKCLNFKEENGSSVGETLVLPPLPSLPCPGLKRLLRLRQRPAIADVHEYWRRKSLELTLSSENVSSNGAQLLEMEDKNEGGQISGDCNITALISDFERMEMQVRGVDLAQCSFKKHPTLVQRLDEMLSDKLHNWIFDYQMQNRGVLIFSHKMLITFSIVMIYEETDLFGNSIKILNIEVQNSRVAKKNWKPIDFLMDFQFRLELPVDLKSACMSSDERDIMKFLQDINKVCVDVVLSGNYLWRLVCSEQASLKRDNGQTIVRKIVREVVAGGYYRQVEKTEYKVELTNLKTLSFKNIIFPPLHAFNESIQFLPIGLDFLYAFLRKPGEHLKKKKIQIRSMYLQLCNS